MHEFIQSSAKTHIKLTSCCYSSKDGSCSGCKQLAAWICVPSVSSSQESWLPAVPAPAAGFLSAWRLLWLTAVLCLPLQNSTLLRQSVSHCFFLFISVVWWRAYQKDRKEDRQLHLSNKFHFSFQQYTSYTQTSKMQNNLMWRIRHLILYFTFSLMRIIAKTIIIIMWNRLQIGS